MKPCRALRRCGALALSVACLTPAEARAQARERVVLLDPPQRQALNREVVARVRGELSAAGFEVLVVRIRADLEPESAVENLGREFDPALVVVLAQSTDAATGEHIVEVWFSDELRHQALVQRLTLLPTEASRGAARLAVQVVELLKARHAELAIADQARAEANSAARRGEPAGTALANLSPADSASLRSTQALASLGGGVLHDFAGSGAVWLPLLRVGVLLPAWEGAPIRVQARGSVSALGQELRLAGEPGVTRLRQDFAELEGVIHVGPNWAVQPVLSLGVGAYSVSVTGEASSPYEGGSTRTWSALSSVGAGVWARAFPWLACSAEAQVLAAWSKTVVRVSEQEIASPGQPMLLLSGALVAVF